MIRPGARRAILVALAFVAVGAGALEVTNGQVKLTLHEGIGRFSISVLAGSGGTWTPLLVAQDPRTSMVSLLVADRVIRLGESSEFSESVEKTDTGARFVWTSRQLEVTQSFSFIGEPGGESASGVRVDLQVRNLTTRAISVGIRYLFDTWLGEASAVHFRTDTIAGLSREMSLASADRTAYWVSPLAEDTGGFGLQCMLSGEGVTVPDRVVFANWKRLSDAPWSYTASSARTFSQAPYSVNDSAVGQYYDARPVERGGSIAVTLAIGRASPAGLTLQTAVKPLEVATTETTTTTAETTATEIAEATETAEATEATEAAETAEAAETTETAEATEAAETTETAEATEAAETTETPGTTAAEQVAAAREDLVELNALLAEVDRLLSLPERTPEDVVALEQALAALRARAALLGAVP